MKPDVLKKRQKIFITGQVQGVGFRPAVYRIARSLGLSGFVYNDTSGVTIELQGQERHIANFLHKLQFEDKPPLAQLKSCHAVDIDVAETEKNFIIKPSESEGQVISQVTADMTVCSDCLAEMANKNDFRYRYPFINCTNCGPRYSIVKTIPYDRCNTTMSVFEMCQKCAAQYKDVTDRRFHAQPVACANDGPKIWLTNSKGKTLKTKNDEVVADTARLLLDGQIVAIKGIGGFHLAVDALNEEAVKRLRQRKKRDHKPFAMMTDSVKKIRDYAEVSQAAKKVLESSERPIVLLPKKKGAAIASSVTEGVNTFGFMLCYAPLHYLLFGLGLDVLVMTSGNLSNEPLICRNDIAVERLGNIADAFLMHDREIYRQVDDSIVHMVAEEPVLLRRARGYVPTPTFLTDTSAESILATGGDLKNTFCLVKQNQLICSEHIGDLEDGEVYHHYIGSVEHLCKLFEVEPKKIVCDLHPGYFSTQYSLAQSDVEVLQVQHHWAHIASVLAEHSKSGPAIGLECDGTGYGTDGAIWGCECLIATLEDFERFGHLSYYTLAGGDLAGKEAIRPVLALLKKTYAEEFKLEDFAWLFDRIEPEKEKQRVVLEQIEKGLNCIETSSLGRVFDAIAAMIGLGNYNYFEAQLPMALESIIERDIEQQYEFDLLREKDKPVQLDLSRMFKQLIQDIKQQANHAVISAKFHNTIASALVRMAETAREKTGLTTAALSGGVFCNRYLINRTIKLLKKKNFEVLFNKGFPSNDGGLALGQAAIAARHWGIDKKDS